MTYIISEIGQHKRHVFALAVVSGLALLYGTFNLAPTRSPLNCPDILVSKSGNARIQAELDNLSIETQKWLYNRDLTQAQRRAELQKLCRSTYG